MRSQCPVIIIISSIVIIKQCVLQIWILVFFVLIRIRNGTLSFSCMNTFATTTTKKKKKGSQ